MTVKDDLWSILENELFSFSTTEVLFNQYKQVDPGVDLPNANDIRKQNLMNYLESFSERPSILVVGEAAGPWGCRFSGVPFTGEKQLCMHTLPFSGYRSSRKEPLLKTKKMPPYTSRSAETFWEAMISYHTKFFVWDCVPFHPHNPGNILSVRNPTKEEVSSCSELLREIKDIIRPRDILAIGRAAEFALKQIGVEPIYVRHPSRGGANRFRTEVKRFFKVN
jgi:uracil-DNA glycosylase